MTITDTTENPQQWQSELLDPRGQNTISELAQVKVYNHGNHDLVWEWGGEKKIIPCDKGDGRNYAIVPYHMAVYWVGDPRAVDVPGNPKERPRTHEFERLCVVYGVYENTNGMNAELGTVENFPNVTVVTPTNEHRITTVLDDPDGETLRVGFQARNDLTATQELLAATQQQMQMLQQQIDQLRREAGQREGASVPSLDGLSERQIAAIKVSDDPQYTPEPVDETDERVGDDADDQEPPRIIEHKPKAESAANPQIAAALQEGDGDSDDDSGPKPDTATRTVPMFGKKGGQS